MTQKEEKIYSYAVVSKDPVIIIENQKTKTPPIYPDFTTINNIGLIELINLTNPYTVTVFIGIVCSLLKMEKNKRIENLFDLNQTELAEKIKISRRQIIYSIKELIENNYIKKIEKTLYMVNPEFYYNCKNEYKGLYTNYINLKNLFYS